MSAMEPIDPATQTAVSVHSAPPPARRTLDVRLRTVAVRSAPMLVYQLNRLGRGGVMLDVSRGRADRCGLHAVR